jgi:hypothetical protein
MMYGINNSSKNHEQDRVNLLGYITPILMDYAENNRIHPVVCYEACHELELMIAEQCKAKGITTDELQHYKLAAEVNFKVSSDSLIKDRIGRFSGRETQT